MPHPPGAPPASVESRCPDGIVRAVIDVGTNSVKLLVGHVHRGSVSPLLERSEQTRLGEGFFEHRILRADAIRRTAEAVERFRLEAARFQPASLRLLATAAAREALNRTDLLAALREVAGVDVEIISGDTEAELAFRGVCSGPATLGQPLLVTDVGGGSTEFIIGQDGRREFSRSFPLGAVRVNETLRPSANPSPVELRLCREHVMEFLAREVSPLLLRPNLLAPPPPTRTFIGVGGTIVILARMKHAMTDFDRDRIESTEISAAELAELTERLWSMPLAARRQVPGLPPERADIILPGIVIYESILSTFELPSVRPCTRGLRFAALL